jgi:hypothetical protein
LAQFVHIAIVTWVNLEQTEKQKQNTFALLGSFFPQKRKDVLKHPMSHFSNFQPSFSDFARFCLAPLPLPNWLKHTPDFCPEKA